MADKEIEIGHVSDYFAHVGVAAITMTAGSIRVGDVLRFKGHTTDLIQEISSMQIEHENVKEAKKGDDVGIKVTEKVRSHDVVYKVVSEE
jgi:translation initiation factor IF-2